MVDVPDHKRFVQGISEYPIAIQLFNSAQRNMLQNMKKKGMYIVYYFDATEKMLNYPIDRENTKTYPLNFYTILLEKMDQFEVCVPVGAIVSERKRAMDIQYFLSVWLDYMGVKPKEVVMDQEAASIVAFLRVFNNLNLDEYNTAAFDYLNDRCKFNFVLIRLDKNHIAHTFSKITLAQDNACHDLVRRSVLKLVEEHDFNYIMQVFGNLLVLLNSNRKSQAVIDAEIFLNRHVRKSLEAPVEDYPISSFDFGVQISNLWFDSVEKNASQSYNQSLDISMDNPYFDVKIASYLESISKKVLLWTAVLPFKKKSKKISGSSAAIESYHNQLKNRVLLGKVVDLDVGITAFHKLIDYNMNRKTGNLIYHF